MRRKDEATALSGTEFLLAEARARLRRLEPWAAAAVHDEWAARP